VADERAVPEGPPDLRETASGARRASVPAPEQPALHRRGGGRLVASGRAVLGLRARGLLRRAPDLPDGAGARLSNAAQRVPAGRDRPDLDRDPGFEGWHLPR